jgi:acyl-CoA thioesterase
MTAHPFTDLTTVTDLGGGTFSATIGPVWTVGPKVHGGCMMAVCAAAAQQAIGPASELAPIALSANYLSALEPGDVQLSTTTRKRGRQVSLVDVQLSQHGRTAVSCAVTLGTPDAKPPRYQDRLALPAMPVEPPADAVPVGAGNPPMHVMNIGQGFDLRIDSSTPFLQNLEGDPVTRMWLRPFAADEAQPDTVLYFALMAGDITPPVTMNRGHFGWAPTVQLTTYLRHRPAPGWLRAIANSRVVGETWFEEDHLIFDANGQVVVQSRQLAMLPKNAWSAIDRAE